MYSMACLPAFIFAFLCQRTLAAAALPECKRFDAIYKSGKELCENMWDGAFKYETDEAKAYTQWFFSSNNPNDDVARSMGKLGNVKHDTCHLNYFHKDAPGPEPDAFTECHPWKNHACCSHGTVETHTKLKEGYGKEYHWDRCGPLSPECERFFVQEACFYECDPNAGLYRKFSPAVYNKSNKDHNEWQLLGMPIKASYCDAWFTACRKDKFCASGGGSYFSCATEYKAADASVIVQQSSSGDGLGTGAIVGFIIAGVLIFTLVVCGCFIIMRERSGKPLFGKLLDSSGGNNGQAIGSSNI